MTKEELKQYIDDNIYENEDGSITGEALNEVLKAIVDDGGTDVVANPTAAATAELSKIKIGETVYDIEGGGTEVEANPTSASTAELSKIKIGEMVYDCKDVIDGYYDNTSGKFYADQQHTTEITGASNMLYIDLESNETYRYDTQEASFIKVNDTSGERRVDGTKTESYRKTVNGDVGDYAEPEIAYNNTYNYYDLPVAKGEVVYYKAKDHRSGSVTTQPVIFIDGSNVIRFKPPVNYGHVYQGAYEAPSSGIFTINQRSDSSGWDEVYLYKIVAQGSADQRVDILATRVDALQGHNGVAYKKPFMDDTDTGAVELNDRSNTIDLKQLYPWCNKFGNKIQLSCKVTTMGTLRFWFDTPGVAQANTLAVYDHRLLTIDDTYIKLYDMHDISSPIDTVTHGLTIEDYLSVNLQCLADGTMKVCVNTLDQVMTLSGNPWAILNHWGYGVGRIKLESNECVMSDVQLSVTNEMFRSPFWMFGASQEGLKDTRYPGQLMKMGYLNVLDNARSGRSSDSALNDLNRALTFGRPKYLYFSLSNDGYNPNTYIPRLEEAMSIAEEIGAELIVMARVVHPAGTEPIGGDTVEAQQAKRDYILNCGARVFDFGKAVSADPDDPTKIYSGYLDNAYLHPANAVAANAVAMQFCADVPEIMQYGSVK